MLVALTIGLFACSKETADNPTIGADTATRYQFERPTYLNRNLNEPATNLTTNEGVELGRMLFYDPQLSGNSTISCASCHKPELAFTDGLATSVGINGQIVPRSSMALTNKVWETHQFWDGRQATLESLIHEPLQASNEMGSSFPLIISRLSADSRYAGKWRKAFGTNDEVNQDRIEKALSQFMRSLQSTNSRYDRFLRGEISLTPQEALGMQLFFTHPDARRGIRGGNCGDCHTPGNIMGDLFEFNQFKNNGSASPQELQQDPGRMRITGRQEDLGRFKITTLRNIAVTAPYMHNGKFRTLEQVLDHYNGPIIMRAPGVDSVVRQGTNNLNGTSLGLTADEKTAIITFLHTLTDSSFLNNPKHKSPF